MNDMSGNPLEHDPALTGNPLEHTMEALTPPEPAASDDAVDTALGATFGTVAPPEPFDVQSDGATGGAAGAPAPDVPPLDSPGAFATVDEPAPPDAPAPAHDAGPAGAAAVAPAPIVLDAPAGPDDVDDAPLEATTLPRAGTFAPDAPATIEPPAPAAPPAPAPVDASLDRDGDGQVTLEEVSQHNDELIARHGAEPVPAHELVDVEGQPLSPERLAEIDIDGDGVVTRGELAQLSQQAIAGIGTTPGDIDPPEPGGAIVLDPDGPTAQAPAPAPADDGDALQQAALDAARRRRAELAALIAADDAAHAQPMAATPVQTVLHVAAPAPPAPHEVTQAAAAMDLPPEHEMVELADMQKLFGTFGVESRLVHGATLEQLRNALARGRGVVLSVDGDEYHADDDGPGDTGADRAIVVSAIDADRGLAYLYEPPHGEIFTIPLDRLVDAWDDSGNEMLVVHGNAPDAGHDDGPDRRGGPHDGDEHRNSAPADDGGDDGPNGPNAALVVLPLALAGTVGAYRVRVRNARRGS
jgi:hypothetical protein